MPNVAHALVKLGADVHVLMTKNATEFISPLVFETLTRRRCQVDTFDRNFQYDVAHISLANAAELFKGILCNGGHAVFSNYWELGLTSLQGGASALRGIAILLAVDAAHERGVSLRTKSPSCPRPPAGPSMRSAFLFSCSWAASSAAAASCMRGTDNFAACRGRACLARPLPIQGSLRKAAGCPAT